MHNDEIETESGRIRMHNIQTIKEDKNYYGDLEISISYDLYNFNIAEYKEIYDSEGTLTSQEFIKYINNDNNENKDLIILCYLNNNHFIWEYYKNNKNVNQLNPDLNIKKKEKFHIAIDLNYEENITL